MAIQCPHEEIYILHCGVGNLFGRCSFSHGFDTVTVFCQESEVRNRSVIVQRVKVELFER